MTRTTDGFELADEDLRLRGEGTLFDTKQSGMPDLKLARLAEDLDLVKRARARAFDADRRRSRPRGPPGSARRAAGPVRGLDRLAVQRLSRTRLSAPRPILARCGSSPGTRERDAPRAGAGRRPTRLRPGPGGALLEPRAAHRGRARPGPVRGDRRGRHRGAVPGRGARDLRGQRARPPSTAVRDNLPGPASTIVAAVVRSDVRRFLDAPRDADPAGSTSSSSIHRTRRGTPSWIRSWRCST